MKKQVTLRIDEDVLKWFKSGGKGYHGRMNDALRNHMDYEGGKSALNGVDLSGDDNLIDEVKQLLQTVSEPKEIEHYFFRPMPKTGKKKK